MKWFHISNQFRYIPNLIYIQPKSGETVTIQTEENPLEMPIAVGRLKPMWRKALCGSGWVNIKCSSKTHLFLSFFLLENVSICCLSMNLSNTLCLSVNLFAICLCLSHSSSREMIMCQVLNNNFTYLRLIDFNRRGAYQNILITHRVFDSTWCLYCHILSQPLCRFRISFFKTHAPFIQSE